MKRVLLVLSLFFSLFIFASCSDNEKYDVVCTNYVSYDAVRASTKDTTIKVKMILKPGLEIHDHELSMSEKRAILNAKMFVLVGGESDTWASSMVDEAKTKGVKVMSMFEILEDSLLLEEGEEDEYDEHVWTDPTNYERIIKDITYELTLLFPNLKEVLDSYSETYRAVLLSLDKDMKTIISRANKKMIVVADRNPFLYFSTHYNIPVYGALKGCSTDGTASANKIIELTKIVEENKLKYIFTIELSKGSIAKTLSDEVDKDIRNNKYSGEHLTVRTLYSMHNISESSFNNGMTYNDMLRKNIEILEIALS